MEAINIAVSYLRKATKPLKGMIRDKAEGVDGLSTDSRGDSGWEIKISMRNMPFSVKKKKKKKKKKSRWYWVLYSGLLWWYMQ